MSQELSNLRDFSMMMNPKDKRWAIVNSEGIRLVIIASQDKNLSRLNMLRKTLKRNISSTSSPTSQSFVSLMS